MYSSRRIRFGQAECSCGVQIRDAYGAGVSRIVLDFLDGDCSVIGSLHFDSLSICADTLASSNISVTFRSSCKDREFQFSSTAITNVTCNTSPPGVSITGRGLIAGEPSPRGFRLWLTHQPTQPYSDSILSDFSIDGFIELSPCQPTLPILPGLRFFGV